MAMTLVSKRPHSLEGRAPKDWPTIKCGCGIMLLWDPKKGTIVRCPTCFEVDAAVLAPEPVENSDASGQPIPAADEGDNLGNPVPVSGDPG